MILAPGKYSLIKRVTGESFVPGEPILFMIPLKLHKKIFNRGEGSKGVGAEFKY